MQYEINTSDNSINWAAKGTERIIQNVINLISTYRYEVAYDRILGLNPDLIHMPINQIEAEITNEIISLISDYESRATVESVDFIGVDDEGNMQFKVVIDIE